MGRFAVCSGVVMVAVMTVAVMAIAVNSVWKEISNTVQSPEMSDEYRADNPTGERVLLYGSVDMHCLVLARAKIIDQTGGSERIP